MRRGGKVGIALLVIGGVLAGGLVIADRIAVGAAEDRIADQAGQELSARKITTASGPTVDIAGFPFLTQVLAGSYDKITVKIPAPLANGVQFENIDLVMSTVKADAAAIIKGTGQVTATRVTGRATLGWDAVRTALQVAGLPGVEPSAVSVSVVNNAVTVKVPVAVAGQQAVLVASGALQVEQGKIRLKLTDIRAEGTVTAVTQRAINEAKGKLAINLNVPAMPYRLVINEVTTSAAGVLIVASADNVVLAG